MLPVNETAELIKQISTGWEGELVARNDEETELRFKFSTQESADGFRDQALVRLPGDARVEYEGDGREVSVQL